MSLERGQRDTLDGDGYIVVADALDRAAVGRLLAAFDHATEQSNGTQHVSLTDATPDVTSWRALVRHPAIVAASAHILGRPFRANVHGRNPLPGFGQQGLHADWPVRAQGDPSVAMTAIFMLDPFTVQNGATRLVPGSHLITSPLPKTLAQPFAKHPHERIITGRAGAVLIFNGHLWHSGRRNDSGAPRRAVQMALVAADAPPVGRDGDREAPADKNFP